MAGWALAATQAWAEVTVTEAWVRTTVPEQKASGAYMKIRSSEDAKLVAASSPVARTVEVHEMTMADNVMKMRAIGALALPAGQTVELKPGGYHVMLIGLVKPIERDQRVPMILTIEGKDGKRSTVKVEATAHRPGDQAGKHK